MAAASVGGAIPKKITPNTDRITTAIGTTAVINIRIFLVGAMLARSSGGAAGAIAG